MEISDLTLRLIVLFIPGVIAALIVNELTVHKSWSSFQNGAYIILLGFLSHLSYHFLQLPFCWLFARASANGGGTPFFWKSLIDKSVPIEPLELLGAALLGVIVGLIVSAFIQHKVLNRVAKFLRISDKYGDENLFSYFLNAKDVELVYIRDRENKYTYEGFVSSFSETSGIREIVLTEVKVYDFDTSEELYAMPRIYLSLSASAVIEVPNLASQKEE